MLLVELDNKADDDVVVVPSVTTKIECLVEDTQ